MEANSTVSNNAGLKYWLEKFNHIHITGIWFLFTSAALLVLLWPRNESNSSIMNPLKRIPFIALTYSTFFTKSWNYDNAYERKKNITVN
jgi:hypothetical protein